MANFSTSSFAGAHLGLLLGHCDALKDRLLDRHLLPLGITAAQLKVLRHIAEGEQTAGTLCQQLGIHSAAMTRMLDRLERKALVERHHDPHDQRQWRLALTEKGLAVSAQLPALADTALREFTAALSAEEVADLRGLLEKMLAR
ncbi:MAG: MarR family transcriptional regulator [Pseudomonas sp.]